MTGVTHGLSFEPKNDKGSNKGDYELFLDLQSGDTVVLTPPVNWMFAGVKVYAATESGGAGNPVQAPQARQSVRRSASSRLDASAPSSQAPSTWRRPRGLPVSRG